MIPLLAYGLSVIALIIAGPAFLYHAVNLALDGEGGSAVLIEFTVICAALAAMGMLSQ